MKQIAVKALCEQGQINRATFYKQYLDVFDLLEQDRLTRLQQDLQSLKPNHYRELLSALLRQAVESKWEILLLGSANGGPEFTNRMLAPCDAQFAPKLQEALPHCTESEQQDAYLFLCGGSAALFGAWLSNDIPASPEELTARLFCLT